MKNRDIRSVIFGMVAGMALMTYGKFQNWRGYFKGFKAAKDLQDPNLFENQRRK